MKNRNFRKIKIDKYYDQINLDCFYDLHKNDQKRKLQKLLEELSSKFLYVKFYKNLTQAELMLLNAENGLEIENFGLFQIEKNENSIAEIIKLAGDDLCEIWFSDDDVWQLYTKNLGELPPTKFLAMLIINDNDEHVLLLKKTYKDYEKIEQLLETF